MGLVPGLSWVDCCWVSLEDQQAELEDMLDWLAARPIWVRARIG